MAETKRGRPSVIPRVDQYPVIVGCALEVCGLVVDADRDATASCRAFGLSARVVAAACLLLVAVRGIV
jgi:hypothetical protein